MTLSGGTPNFSMTSARPIFLSFMVSNMMTPSVTSCIRSLSDDTMVEVAPASLACAHIGRDQVVGLKAVLFEARQIESVHRLADELELRPQVVGRIGPVRLVVGIHLGAERLFRFVEHHREMGRLVLLHVAQELPQHVAEAEHGIELQPVRLAVDRRQRVIGAENVARAVDEKDVIPLLEGLIEGLGGRRSGFRHGRSLRLLCGWHDDG